MPIANPPPSRCPIKRSLNRLPFWYPDGCAGNHRNSQCTRSWLRPNRRSAAA